MSKFRIEVELPSITSNDLATKMKAASSDPNKFVARLKAAITKFALGLYQATVVSIVNAVAASATVTFTKTGEPSDTILVNGVTFTAVASGATGNQWNVGAKATKIVQDLTYTAVLRGVAGNSITIEYTTGGTAGSEVVTVTGSAISVQIQSGVSTATQVKTAVEASAPAAALVAITVSGTGSTAQVAVAAGAMAGGAGSVDLSAASLASAIVGSASALVNAQVTASSAAGVCTVTAKQEGVEGNTNTIAEGVDSSSGIAVSGSGRLTGGTDGTSTTYKFGVA